MNMHSRRLALFALLIVSIVATGCINSSIGTWQNDAYVHGSVRDTLGELVQTPLTISFGSRSVTTDSGYYSISGLPGGAYEVEISGPGYKPFRETVEVPSGGAYRHNFTLIPYSNDPTDRPAAPSTLHGKVIVVDPGHGGFDRSLGDYGAVGQIGMEKHNTLAIGLYLKDLLEEAGAQVIMTRDRDINPSVGTPFEGMPHGQLHARVDLANRSGADVFVSIHNNANPNSQVEGIETFYYSDRGQVLAEHIQRSLIARLGGRDRGTSWASFHVIRETRMPAVLLEIGFVSNPKEDYLLTTEGYRKGAAYGIYQGLLSYFSEVG